MGLIKAFSGAIGGTFADQWIDYVCPPATLTDHVLVAPGVSVKQNNGRGSNTKGSTNIISNGSRILVPEGCSCIILNNGQITDLVTEPGGFVYNTNDPNAQSIFAGDGFSSMIKQSWDRFKCGGQPAANAQVLYINCKEIAGIPYGTQNPIRYKDSNYNNLMLSVTSFGTYSIKVVDPIALVRNLLPPDIMMGNREFDLEDSQAAETLFSGFIGSLATALSSFTKGGKSIDDIQGGTVEFAKSVNAATEENYKWLTNYGLRVESVQPRGLDWDDKSAELVDKFNLGMMMQGNVGNAFAQATMAEGIKAAGENGGGAGLVGVGMGAGMMGSMMQQQPVAAATPATPAADDPMQKLTKLKSMFEAGLINEDEYASKKNEILSQM